MDFMESDLSLPMYAPWLCFCACTTVMEVDGGIRFVAKSDCPLCKGVVQSQLRIPSRPKCDRS